MQYEITIKGKSEPLQVPLIQGGQIKILWEKYLTTRQNRPLEIGNWQGTLADIRYIEKVIRRADKGTHAELDEAYKKDLRQLRAMTPQRLAHNLGFFRLVFFTFTGKKPDVETENKAIEIQKKFFTEHPKRIICDPTLFRSLISANLYRQQPETEFGHISSLLPSAVLKDIGEIARQDVFAEKHL